MVNLMPHFHGVPYMAIAPQPQLSKVASPPPRINPEKITEVAINNGHDSAFLTREVDPKGSIVVHAVKKSSYVHDRMHDLGRIDNDMYDAAERFRKDFERAHLAGRYSSIDMFRSAGGTSGDVSDGVAEARIRIKNALTSLGARRDGKSLSQSCAWFVIGCGHTLEQWSLRMRNSAENMSEGKAAGYLCGALEKLAWYYGLVNTRSIKERASSLAEKRGRMAAHEENVTMLELSGIKDAKTPEEALNRFNSLLKTMKDKVAKLKTVG